MGEQELPNVPDPDGPGALPYPDGSTGPEPNTADQDASEDEPRPDDHWERL